MTFPRIMKGMLVFLVCFCVNGILIPPSAASQPAAFLEQTAGSDRISTEQNMILHGQMCGSDHRCKRNTGAGFVPFAAMKDNRYKAYQYGFPPTSHRTIIFPAGFFGDPKTKSIINFEEVMKTCNEAVNKGCAWGELVRFHNQNPTYVKSMERLVSCYDLSVFDYIPIYVKQYLVASLKFTVIKRH